MRRGSVIAILSLLILTTVGVFSFFALQTFSEDKRLFVMELNHMMLQSTTGHVKLELKNRLDELQIFIPRVFEAKPDSPRKQGDLFANLPPRWKDELGGVAFMRKQGDKIEAFRLYRNQRPFKRKGMTADVLNAVAQNHVLPFTDFYAHKKMRLLNRSILTNGKKGDTELNVITLLLDGSFVPGAPPETVVVVDLLPDFLKKILTQSEIAEVFLMFSDGRVFFHPDPKTTREYSARPMGHPVLARLRSGPVLKETTEMSWNGETYYVSAAETGFDDLFAISQTRKGDLFLSLRTLLEKGMALLVAVGAATLMLILLFFMSRSPAKQTAAPAAEAPVDRLAAPPPAPKLKLARRREPTAPEVRAAAEPPAPIEVGTYLDKTEAPSALTGSSSSGSVFVFYVGEVKPAELPKNLIADARELAQTSLDEARGQALGPGDTLSLCNGRLHAVFRGRLFMTLTIGHLDLSTGKLEIASAGHPPPLLVRAVIPDAPSSDKEEKRKIEALLARGDRLGTKADVGYPSVVYQLDPGDRILAFTHGTIEARNKTGKAWGTEGVAEAFLLGVETGEGLDRVRFALEEHVAAQLPRGDRALLWMEWRERIAKAAETEAPPAAPAASEEAYAGDPESRQNYLYDRIEESDVRVKKAA